MSHLHQGSKDRRGHRAVKRTIFGSEHEEFRQLVRTYLAAEVVPRYPEWEASGGPPKDVFAQLGDIGVVGINMPEAFGGGGQSDYTYNVVVREETARAGVTIGPLLTHLDVVLPYFRRYATPEQQQRWFPDIASGKLMTAIAMTEPDTGSDLAAVRTAAVLDGAGWVLNGSKTYITGGSLADLVIVLARTSRDEENRRNGLTLFIVEAGMPGFTKGRKLDKIGLKAQDTVELAFDDVRVPAANVLGEVGQAFWMLGANLPQERLAIAVLAIAQSTSALDLTIDYVQNRKVFGQPISNFQNTKFELAAIATGIEAGQAMVDKSVTELVAGELTPADAAKAKLFCSELQGRVVDRCLQLFGGFGYINESPIARLYADARVTRIYGGTSEVMKSIISKSLGL
jgi:acyl-CoA dehydrogenase